MAGTVRVVRGDQAGLDRLGVDALVVPLFAGTRQPQGAAGFVDWRLCGRLGRLLLKRQFSGQAGELLLMPALSRLGAERIFVFGLGAQRAATSPPEPRAAGTLHAPPLGLAQAYGRLAGALADAQVVRLAFAPPLPDPVATATVWLDAAAAQSFTLELLDPDGALEAEKARLFAAAARAGWSTG